MAWLHGTAAPKGEKRATSKARADRAEAKVKKAVRAECVERDGNCRICDWERNPDDTHEDDLPQPPDSLNPSEWAHLEDTRRAHTRNMRPELRHHTAGTMMLCRFHHQLYDARTLRLSFLTNGGANGHVEFFTK